MSANPFESPNKVDEPRKPATKVKWWVAFLLKLLALSLWLIAIEAITATYTVLNTPEMVANRVLTPGLFWYIAIVGLGLPIASVVLFAIAAWWQSKPFAYAALVVLALMVANLVGIGLINVTRRWLAI